MIRRLVPLALMGLAGCSLAPTYVRPAAPVPAAFPTGGAYPAQSVATLPAVSYRDIFLDPRLRTLVEQALVNSRNLRVAIANIDAARARYRVQAAAELPTVGISATPSYAGGGNARQQGANYSLSGGVTAFEIDLFGRVRSLTAVQLDTYLATAAGAQATRLTLVGDLATAWLTYASNASLLAIAQETAASAQRSVDLTRRRLEGGIAPRTDVAQAETTLATAQADLAAGRTALDQNVNAIRLLVGADVDPKLLPGSIDEVLPTLAELPAGLESGVLLRRPDVVQAEYGLRAANAQIGEARAELFPRISLTGLLGLASGSLGGLFSGDSFSYSGSGNAGYSIFRAGAGRANVAQARANQRAALASYERAIQTAFREVADALARRGTIGDQEAANRRLLAAAQDVYTLSDLRYRGGITTFLDTLIAQRTLYAAQRGLVATQLTRATNLVTLYRTLGGDALVDPDRPADLEHPVVTPAP